MGLSLDIDLEGFKKFVGDFCKAIPTANRDSLEAGLKMVNIGYLNLDPLPHESVIALSYLKYAHNRYNDRLHELYEE